MNFKRETGSGNVLPLNHAPTRKRPHFDSMKNPGEPAT